MAFSVLGLVVPGMRIENPGCVAKTFPGFYDDAGGSEVALRSTPMRVIVQMRVTVI